MVHPEIKAASNGLQTVTLGCMNKFKEDIRLK
jgi:hypothetical protein